MSGRSWKEHTLNTAQCPGRHLTEKHPSGIHDSANALQKIGHNQRTKEDWNVGIIPNVRMRTKKIDLGVASVKGEVVEERSPLTKSNDITERAERNAAPTIACQLLKKCAGPTLRTHGNKATLKTRVRRSGRTVD